MTANILPVKVDKGQGQPLVLLHGLGNNYRSWTHVLRRLNYRRSRVIALDLLGFGSAPKPRNLAYTPQDHARAVIATLDQMGVTGAVIAGHSMGCVIAIEVAKQRPDLVRRLVLLGAPLYEAMPVAVQRRSAWSRLTSRHSTGAYFTIFSVLRDNPDLTITAAQAADSLLPPLKGMQITEATWPAFKASLNRTIMQFQSYRDALELTTPTLLVSGLLDVFIIRRNLKEIARRNPRVRYKTLLGPHEITPLQGRRIARLLQRTDRPS